MANWTVLIDVLILLAAALLLGTVAERFRQSAIVGYLIAGAVVGPNAVGLVRSGERVEVIAELGIALLLFTIGLEFSFRRLRRFGPVALVGGCLQILFTAIVVGGAVMLMGLSVSAAVVIGALVALSSTATVLRLLTDRGEIESPYGRHALGVLLLQDVAVVPLALLVSALSSGEGPGQIAWDVGRVLIAGAVMFGVFWVLFNKLAPRLLNLRQWAANREFPIVLAVVVAIGSAAAAHQLDIPPSIGAFFAGLLLAESPFAVQVRADVASLRAVFLTLFFASVGMLADPVSVAQDWHVVLLLAAGIIVAKGLLAWGALAAMGVSAGMGLATGLCLAQIGEFSLVLARIAADGGLIGDETIRLLAAATVLTLFVTPYLVRLAGPAAWRLESRRAGAADRAAAPGGDEGTSASAAADVLPKDLVILVGFGPAGQRVAEALLMRSSVKVVVVDLNPRLVSTAERYGLEAHVGNAWQPENLHHAGIERAAVVVVTVPDPENSRHVIQLCRSLNPTARVIARARYHAYRWELQMAGADVVVDEEERVGLRLAGEARRLLRAVAALSAADDDEASAAVSSDDDPGDDGAKR